MRKDGHDVLVAGGGPAGLSVAAEAARQGLSVLVVEREGEIGVPVHTSGGTAPATVLRHNVPSELYHPITTLRFAGPTTEAIFTYEEPVMVVIDVRGTYQLLASRAEELGAIVKTGATARRILRSADGVVEGLGIESNREFVEESAKVVVDATGYRAAVSKLAGLHPGFERFGVGAEVELIAPFCRQDEAVLIVGERYAPSGYGWVFPWGQGRVRVGIGLHHGDVRSNPRDHLETFLQEAGRLGVNLDGSTRVEDHLGLIPAHSLPERFTDRGILAVGDAACQATLVVGEGIRVSLDAGIDAGQVVAQSIKAGTYRADGLAAYETQFRRTYERSLKVGHQINRRLASFDDPEWDEKLGLLRSVPPSALPRVMQSDFSLTTAVALLAGSPRLWGSMAKYAGRAVRQSMARTDS